MKKVRKRGKVRFNGGEKAVWGKNVQRKKPKETKPDKVTCRKVAIQKKKGKKTRQKGNSNAKNGRKSIEKKVDQQNKKENERVVSGGKRGLKCR